MIKPPFTLLILKESRNPTTIRVTTGSLIVLSASFVFVVGILLAVIMFLILPWGTAPDGPHISEPAPEDGESLIAAYESPGRDGESSGTDERDIEDLTIRQGENGSVEISFTFTNTHAAETLYIWLIANPDAEKAGDMMVYPRSPLFRGVPVDYRNGIPYKATENKYLKATLAGPAVGVDLKLFRILAYSPEGISVIDRQYVIEQNIRM